MRTFKIALRIIAFVLVFCLCNAFMTFAITPVSTSSSEMWKNYRAYEPGSLDMVYTGTSVSYEGVDPSVVDAITGHHSYTMGTNSQEISQSVTLIEEAISDHQIQTAVFVLDEAYIEDFMTHNKQEAAFIYSQNAGQSLSYRLKNAVKYLFDPRYFGSEESLQYFFPWIINHARGGGSGIIDNVRAKLSGEEMVIDDQNELREPTGYKPFHSIVNKNTIRSVKLKKWTKDNVSETEMDALARMCQVCAENGTKLIVVAPPYPTTPVLAYGQSYWDRYIYVKEFLDQYGVEYYNFNLVKPELFELKDNQFKDWDHLNYIGAEEFSTSLGNLLVMLENGEDPSDLFYDSYQAYKESITEIDSVMLKIELTEDKQVKVTGGCLIGPNVTPEYQFLIKPVNADDSAYEMIRDYSSEKVVTFTPEQGGEYTIRVNARLEGSESEYDRYYTKNLTYYAD